ncbi:MAG: HigA family addiction module antidote protein [Desulfovibrio sp.]|jgi:addiction module HigA family antidote|nr:HigA family addiction module antidote protein [Desulfovibrio sp.]
MPHTPIHPGEILRDELDELNMNAAQLARAINVPANRISQIVTGKRNISADTALRLGKLLGTGPQFWLNLQMAYDLDVVTADTCPDLDAIIPLAATSSMHSETVRQG